MEIEAGDVGFAYIYDIRGKNGKNRRVVAFLTNDTHVAVAAITTKFDPDNIGDCEVLLPFAENGRCSTGLVEPSLMCGWWVDKIEIAEFQKVGEVPPKIFTEVLRAIQKDQARKRAAAGAQPVSTEHGRRKS